MGVTFDASGNLLVASTGRILRIDAVSSVVSIIAGNGSGTSSGDGGPAINAGIGIAQFVAVDTTGNIFFSDQGPFFVLRKITASSGIVTRVMGHAHSSHCGGENEPPAFSCLTQPFGLDVDANGTLTIADVSIMRLRRVWATTGRMVTWMQMFEAPVGVEHDAAGNLYTASFGRYQIYRFSAVNGLRTVVAGGNGQGSVVTGGRRRPRSWPPRTDVAFDGSGNMYISDSGNNRVRRVEASTGIISTYAQVSSPGTIEFDPTGSLIVSSSCTLRRIDSVTRVVTNLAGTGVCWSSDIPGRNTRDIHEHRYYLGVRDPAGRRHPARLVPADVSPQSIDWHSRGCQYPAAC